jgi:hypothetical protein
MSVIRPWDFSHPHETILDRRNLLSARLHTFGYDECGPMLDRQVRMDPNAHTRPGEDREGSYEKRKSAACRNRHAAYQFKGMHSPPPQAFLTLAGVLSRELGARLPEPDKGGEAALNL